jgi:hemolysin activation/secretion protein
VNYDATAGAFWDVTGSARVLSLSVATLFSDPIKGSGDDIPFNEQVVFGGDGLMRGYLAGRLIGRSGAVATLNYQYPVWAFLDGTLQVSTGNVFGPGLSGLEAKKLRLSTGFGLRTHSSPDNQFELLVGFGTDTFENGAGITSVRLALGATRGF